MYEKLLAEIDSEIAHQRVKGTPCGAEMLLRLKFEVLQHVQVTPASELEPQGYYPNPNPQR